MSISIRAGLLSLVVATALVGCGKKEEAPPAADTAPHAAAAPAAAASTEEKVVNVYNWSDYIEPTPRSSNSPSEDRHQGQLRRLRLERSARDEAARRQHGLRRRRAVGSFMERQIKAGVFLKLDRSQAPNWGNLDPEMLQRVALHDPGNEHAVNYLWGTDGIGYNEGKVKAIDAERAGRQLVARVRSEVGRQVQGLRRLGARRAERSASACLAYLGKDPNSQDAADLEGWSRRHAARDPSVHPHDPHLATTSTTSRTASCASRSAGAATCCSRATARPKPARAP